MAQDQDLYQKILQSHAASIVTLRVLSKIEATAGGQAANQEMRYEIQGVVVDKDGLIMVSNVFLNPYSLNMSPEAAQAGVKLTPTSIKVIFADDDKEYTAFLAATDTKLNLAFVKVDDLAGKTVSPAEFTSSYTPAVGQRLLCVSRLSRGYDYAAFLQSGRINGEIVRPRRAWMVEGGMSGFGLPIFTQGGELAGVLTTIPSTLKEDSQNPDTMGMAMAMRMMTGGILQPFLIPTSTVAAVITQARASAIEVAARRKAGKPATPTADKAAKAPPQITTKPKKP
jgi:hypothetical protein